MNKTMTEQASNEQTASQDWKPILTEWRTLQQSAGANGDTAYENITVCTIIILGIFLLLGCVLQINIAPGFGGGVILIFTVAMAYILNAIKQDVARFQKSEQKLLASLEQITDVDALGDVIQAFENTSSPSGRIAMQKIVLGLLERQTPEHHTTLTPAHRRLLGRLLERGSKLPQPHTSNGYLVLLDSAADVQLQRACLRVLPFLSDQTPSDQSLLPNLARMIARDAPSREGPVVRDEARQLMRAQIARLDFGSVEKIPYWIGRLPFLREGVNEGAEYPSGLNLDECIIAVCALTRLLPQMTPAHSVLLDSQARKRLREAPRTIRFILGTGLDSTMITASRLGPDFTLAVLRALELFGAAEDLPFVRYWANMGAPTSDLEHIRHRARQVVPVLEARQKKEELSLSLLRGSSAPPPPANQLLRPATGHTTREPASELLRPQTAPPAQNLVESEYSESESSRSKDSFQGTEARADRVINSSTSHHPGFNTSAQEQMLPLRIDGNNASN